MSSDPKYVLKGDISEKQIESDVSRFLGWSAPTGKSFRLLDVDEQLTGADKKFNFVVPLYLQFKKSQGLEPFKKQRLPLRIDASSLHKIRIFRHEQGLADDPTLYFQVRKKAKTANDFQHNILMSYHRPPLSYAVYVAPLDLDSKQYDATLFNSVNRLLPYPFLDRSIKIIGTNWTSYYGFIPFLRNHVSIVPHQKIEDAEHFYAYSTSGDDISWHSPQIVQQESSRLSDFTVSLYRQLYSSFTESNNIATVLASLIEMVAATGESASDIFAGDGPLEQLQSHGKWLAETHSIRQLLFLQTPDA